MLGVRKTLGHDDVKTTMIYTHVLSHGSSGFPNPADAFCEEGSYADPHSMLG